MSFLKPLTLTLVISILILFLINLFQNIKSQSSKLVIDSIPKTEVFIDGNRIGETPVSEISKKEEVQVKLKKDDLSYEKYITLTKGVETILKISLNQDIHKTEEQILTLEATGEKKSSISLTTEPDGVQIYLDGKFVGVSPQKIVNIEPSIHEITMLKDGFNQKEVTIKTTEGYTLDSFAKLASSDSSVQN